MKYDFESLVIRRGVGSFKWNEMEQYPETPADVVPLSVADMEFRNAPEIVEGLKTYLDTSILGYTGATDAYYDAVIGWMEHHHGFSPKKEWFFETPGVVAAIRSMIRAFTAPTDSVMITTPVYAQFRNSVEFCGRTLVENPLLEKDGEYTFDFADFEEKVKRPEVTLYILCNPHNPTGYVWRPEELERIAALCYENGVFIISDEIHSDLVFRGHQCTSMMTMKEEWRRNCAVCTSPSKTFNLAGLQASNTFVSDPARMALLQAQGRSALNALSYKAVELAYTKCEGWYEEMLSYIEANADFVLDFVARRMPYARVKKPEGTYLIWIDFRALGLQKEEQEKLMKEDAFAFFDGGWMFGEAGLGFERINLACPRRILETTLERVANAIEVARRAGKIKF